jgi:hypothetical protein
LRLTRSPCLNPYIPKDAGFDGLSEQQAALTILWHQKRSTEKSHIFLGRALPFSQTDV